MDHSAIVEIFRVSPDTIIIWVRDAYGTIHASQLIAADTLRQIMLNLGLFTCR